jgi:hypothetical protein
MARIVAKSRNSETPSGERERGGDRRHAGQERG